MQKKLIWMVPAVALVSLAFAPLANAEGGRGLVRIGASMDVEVNAEADADVRSGTGEENTSATMNARGDANAEAKAAVEASESSAAAEHRSAVSTFVHSLLDIADRDGGIGSDVRAVAHSEDEAAGASVEAMAKVESRNALVTLLFGADIKNLGVLRSALATTSANIAQLKRALVKSTDASVKASLSAQISALESAQARTTAFISAHEDVFSVFGWFTRLFGTK